MMHKIQLILVMLMMSCITLWAQSPNAINYQGVAHQSNGNAISNQPITLRLSVRHAATNGVVQYSETRQVTTSSEGLFNVQLGSAGAVSTTGSWSAINWEGGPKFLQVEMDALGGSNFTNIGTQELVSVPYAQYANQAGALVSTATIHPSQLNTSGASINDVLQFDGTHWVPASMSAGSLGLPYIVADPNLVSFGITNTSALGGSAIYGKANTSNVNASGVRGESVGALGNGVYGKAAGALSFGVLGQNTTGIGVKGVSNAVNAIGVYGETASGTGVKGYSNDAGSAAVFGSSFSGTGVKAFSISGNALDVIGNLKISGGSVAPTKGAVLTSDSVGNATWKTNRVAFGASGVNTNFDQIPNSTNLKVEFNTEQYDVNNNFSPNNSTISNANTSVFTVPASGIYNLNAYLSFNVWDSTTTLYTSNIFVMCNRNGTTTTLFKAKGNVNQFGPFDDAILQINTEDHLLAGDKVWIEVDQYNTQGSVAYMDLSSGIWFRSTLLIAD